jgi:hypothetical protein
MKYWLDLFTGTTWEEFRKSGANVSGFSDRMRKNVERMGVGDVLLCYLTGVMRWVGALEVLGASQETRRIWKDAEFPARVSVKPLVMLSPENGVPMNELEGKVSFFEGKSDRGKFKGFVRMSPNLFRAQTDGDLILKLLQEAELAPVARPVDAKKLARRPFFKAERRKGKETVSTVVTVPESEEGEEAREEEAVTKGEVKAAKTRHTEIQWQLLTLGDDQKDPTSAGTQTGQQV